MRLPRIMLAAPKSGSGKTLLTCALLGACKDRQLDVVSCKCGPDYIDPMFHRTVLGIPSENLDTFFTDAAVTRRIFGEFARTHDMTVMEGVMGLYDGLGGIRPEGSSYHLATVTRTPIILVVDVHGMGRTMIPMISGILQADTKHLIRGIILNRISKNFYATMKPVLEEELPVRILGYMEMNPNLTIESRHLGLRLPNEIADIRETLQLAAEQLEGSVDVNGILDIANSAEEYSIDNIADNVDTERIGAHASGCDLCGKMEKATVTLAVARDEAFCFYYDANLRMLRRNGVKLVEFSPLHDAELPKNADGILLGGGYPEVYAELLSNNKTMLRSIRDAINGGMPSLAECGGFMYLHRELEDAEGKRYPMANVLDARTYYTGKSLRFGYVELQERSSPDQSFFLVDHDKIKGHEFHYYDSTACGEAALASKPINNRQWECCHISRTGWWGFPHLYYPSCPEFVRKFVTAMRSYHDSKNDNI